MNLRQLFAMGIALSWLTGHPARCADALRFRPTETRLPPAGTTVPLDWVDRLPLVSVKINGQGPFLCIVDTGASLTALNRTAAMALKLKPTKSAAVGDHSGDAGRAANVAEVQTIELGEATFTGTDAVIVDLDFVVGPGRTIDGLLGFGLFADTLLTLDYPGRKLVLERGELPAPDGRDVLRYRLAESLPRVALPLAERSVTLTVDSGSNGCLTLPRSMRKQLTFRTPPVPMGRVQRAQADPSAELARVAGGLAVGRHVVNDPLVRLLGNAGVLGNQVLEQFIVTFDQKHTRVRFAREAAEPITIPPVRSRGFYTEVRQGVPVVVEVIAGTPAEQGGMRVGDRVIRVNERAAADVDAAAWAALFNGTDPLRLTLQRRKETVEITVPMIELVP